MAKSNDFQSFIQDARERKKNTDLADKIFSKNRRRSAPAAIKPTPGGSLASRVGVKKPRASLNPRAAQQIPAGDVNGEWTHDLHNTVNGDKSRSLGARIGTGNAALKQIANANTRANRKTARRAAALDRMDVDQTVQQQVNVRAPPKGMSIRGLAGPFTVMAQNFAPGTTAADIESAMTPVGGEMEDCRIIKTKPFIVVEMVFASKEGADRVIDTFNDQTADGRLLKVYPKTVGKAPGAARAETSTKDQVVDGSMGFPEPKQKGQLYSDKMVGNNNKPQRGRGGQRGRGR